MSNARPSTYERSPFPGHRHRRWLHVIVLGLAVGCGYGCSSGSTEPAGTEWVTVTGRVADATTGLPLSNAYISVPTDPQISPRWTGPEGTFRIDSVRLRGSVVRVERAGYETYEVSVSSAVNGIATLNPLLKAARGPLPSDKPLSNGPVRIRDRALEVDDNGDGVYEPFFVKGVAYAPTPIGSSGGQPDAVHDRSMPYLTGMHANTIRTYSGASRYLLDRASEHGIRVIVGYWVSLEADLSDEAVRSLVIEGFERLVLELHDHPAVLMWNLGNEQNYSSAPNNGASPFWFSLANELAMTAFRIEGDRYHPVCINQGGVWDIGSPLLGSDDSSLSYIDAWASNLYSYDLRPHFERFRTLSAKPIVLTEFGIDAYDNRTRSEYELVQASFDSTNWRQLLTASDVCLGGTLFEFTDEWWKAGDPWSRNDGGYPTGQHPDGYSNEEWWGVIRVTPDSDNDGLDEWTPRQVYHTFRLLWQ